MVEQPDEASEHRDHRVGGALRTIQVVVVLTGVTLLIVHTLAEQWTLAGKPLTVDAVSLGLIAVIAAGLLLARVDKVKWGDAEISLGRRIREAKAALEELPTKAQSSAGLERDDLQAVVDDPAGVIRQVHRTITAHLQEAAVRAGVDGGQLLSAAEAVRRLAGAGKFDASQARAIGSVIRAVQTARLGTATSPAAADLRKFEYLIVELADAVS